MCTFDLSRFHKKTSDAVAVKDVNDNPPTFTDAVTRRNLEKNTI